MAHELETDWISSHQGTVKDMPSEEQPREKLELHGPETLTDAELLAILMRTGSKNLNVVETAKKLLKQFGGLGFLCRKEWKEIKSVIGIGRVKAITLTAAFELGKRIQIAELGDRIQIKSPDDAAAFFLPRMRDLRKEVFIVAFMNAAKILIGFKKISTGGQTSTIVDPSEVMRESILNDAHSIIVLHNHPSQNPKPSPADIRLTKRLVESGKIIGISVEDHLIIAGNTFTSLRSEGLM